MKGNPVSFKLYIQLLFVHIGLALGAYLFPSISKFLLLGVVGIFFFWVLASANRKDQALLGAAYITGFEVFSRMTGGTLTYEFAKYAVILFLGIGMFYRGFTRKSWAYLFYLLCLTPGILFSAINLDYATNVANAIGFNLSGPVCLGISALYCYNRKMPLARLQGILLALLLPIFSTAVYLYFYTPDIKEVVTGTYSNYATSGGFGPNQVATILGLGVFLLFSRLLVIKNRSVNIVDLVLLSFIGYRTLVTFSRGGTITAVVCIALFITIYFIRSSSLEKAKLLPKGMLLFAVLTFTWLITSLNTSGLIDKRYANQDAAGRVKEDVTTGRTELITTELQAFYENPILGIGVGKVKEYREEVLGELSATHNEVTRLLSEHGSFGLIALLVLIVTPLIFRIKDKSNLYLYSCVAFWFLTINHSSMRIAAPAFVYGLSLISIVNAKKKSVIHRK